MKRILLLILSLVSVQLVCAQSIPYNHEFQVNAYTSGSQRYPAIAGLSNGGFVICWENGSKGIFCQIYNKERIKVGSEFEVDSRGFHYPNVISMGGDKFVVCWKSETPYRRSSEIMAKIYTNNGVQVSDEILVFSSTLNVSGWAPCITESGNGGFIIVCAFGGRILGKRFSKVGTQIGNEFQANSIIAGSSNPNISLLSDGSFVVIWRRLTGEFLMYGQIFDENGSFIGNNFLIGQSKARNEVIPSVAGLSNNSFIVCWENSDIEAVFFSNYGEKLGEKFSIEKYTKGHAVHSPCVSKLSNDRFIVSWEHYNRRGIWGEIFARMFYNDGTFIGKEFHVNNYNGEYQDQQNAKVCAVKDEGILISWESEDQDGSEFGIFAKYYFANPIKHLLRDFSYLLPSFDATMYRANPTFTWQKGSETRINFPWELTYDLYIDTDYNFTNPRVITAIEDTTYQIDSLAPGNTYFWKVLARNYYGDSLWSSGESGFYIEPNATDVESDNQLPDEFNLSQNYPNPFNPFTKIKYTLPVETQYIASLRNVSLKIYDILGNEITTLVNKEQSPGTYEVEFDGSELASGLYIYRLNYGVKSIARKMVLIK